MYEVHLSLKPRKLYAKAEKPLARKLARCFGQLEKDPRHHSNIKRLKGKLAGHYRFRAGNYRVIYRIDDQAGVVFVVRIAHRSEAYG